jgi:hypothetical protein
MAAASEEEAYSDDDDGISTEDEIVLLNDDEMQGSDHEQEDRRVRAVQEDTIDQPPAQSRSATLIRYQTMLDAGFFDERSIALVAGECTRAQFQHVAEKLQKNTTLYLLANYNNSIGIDAVRFLAIGFADHQVLTMLMLCSCNIDDETGEILASLLLTNRSITEFRLDDNEVGVKTAKQLHAALILEDAVVQRVFLSSNQLENPGVRYLADALSRNKSLISLSVINNNADRHCLEYLITTLKYNRTLEQLMVAENDDLTEHTGLIVSVFTFNPSLVNIYTGQADIGKETCALQQRNMDNQGKREETLFELLEVAVLDKLSLAEKPHAEPSAKRQRGQMK